MISYSLFYRQESTCSLQFQMFDENIIKHIPCSQRPSFPISLRWLVADVISCCHDQLREPSRISAHSPHSSHGRKASWVVSARSCCFHQPPGQSSGCELMRARRDSYANVVRIRERLSALWTHGQKSSSRFRGTEVSWGDAAQQIKKLAPC